MNRSTSHSWLALAVLLVNAIGPAVANPLLLGTMDLYNDANMDGVYTKEEVLILQQLEKTEFGVVNSASDTVAFELRIQVSDVPTQGLHLTDLGTPNFMLPFVDIPGSNSCNDFVGQILPPGGEAVCYFSVSKSIVLMSMGSEAEDAPDDLDLFTKSVTIDDPVVLDWDTATFEVTAAFGWQIGNLDVIQLPLTASTVITICEDQDCTDPMYTPTPAPVSADEDGSAGYPGEQEAPGNACMDPQTGQDVVVVLDSSTSLSDEDYDLQKAQVVKLTQGVAASVALSSPQQQPFGMTVTGGNVTCSIRISVVQYAGQEGVTSCPLVCATEAVECVHAMQRLDTNYLAGLRPLSIGLKSANRELRANGVLNSKKTVAIIANYSHPTGLPSIKAEKDTTRAIAKTLNGMDVQMAVVQFRKHHGDSFLESIATMLTLPDGTSKSFFNALQDANDTASTIAEYICVELSDEEDAEEESSESGHHFHGFLNQEFDFIGEDGKIYNLIKDVGITVNGLWGYPEMPDLPELPGPQDDNDTSQAPWIVELGVELVPDMAKQTSDIIQIQISLSPSPDLEQCQLFHEDCYSVGSITVNGKYLLQQGRFNLQENYTINIVQLSSNMGRIDISSPHANLVVYVRKQPCTMDQMNVQFCPHIDLSIKSIDLFSNATGILGLTAESDFKVSQDNLSDFEEPSLLPPL